MTVMTQPTIMSARDLMAHHRDTMITWMTAHVPGVDEQEARKRTERWISHLSQRLVNDFGITNAEAGAATEAGFTWLQMCATTEDRIIPTDEQDMAWHNMLVDNPEYNALTIALTGGQIIYHTVNYGGVTDRPPQPGQPYCDHAHCDKRRLAFAGQ